MDSRELQKRLGSFATQAMCEGSHIVVARRWMQRNFRNGSTVMWNGDEALTGTHLLPRQVEDLAIEIAQAVIKDMEQYLLRKRP